MRQILLCGAASAVLALSGCAKPPSQIGAAYIDTQPYRALTCDELAQRAHMYSQQAAQAVGAQEAKANSDAVMVGVSLLIFWPAAFFTSRDTTGEMNISLMRGHMNAIEQVALEKNCNFVIQKY